MINILSAGGSSLANFVSLVDSCYDLAKDFDVISFHFVKRSGNAFAHALATSACLYGLEGNSLPRNLFTDAIKA